MNTALLPHVVLAAVLVVATACTPTTPLQPPAPTTASPAASATTTIPVSPQTGQSSSQSYTVHYTDIDGATSDSAGQWTTRAGLVDGGNPQVAGAFNAASRNSVNNLIDTVRDQAHADKWTFDAHSAVSFQPVAISQVTTGSYYAAQAAHPADYLTTIVIDSRDARPITLGRLFSDEAAGLNRLSETIRQIQQVDSAGNAPTEQNFANWIPTADGMEIHFSDYQSGHGLPVFTVPWSALAEVLAPDMRALTGSPS